MKNWIKKKLGITQLENENKVLRNQLQSHREYVAEKIGELKEYTRVDADMGVRGNNTIVLTGVYRKRAFVQFYDIGDGEFQRLVEMLRDMKDHALVRHIDKPPSFHGTFEI
jgi:ATP-dependent exoDNAse (exonuclease V) alpha subunit